MLSGCLGFRSFAILTIKREPLSDEPVRNLTRLTVDTVGGVKCGGPEILKEWSRCGWSLVWRRRGLARRVYPTADRS